MRKFKYHPGDFRQQKDDQIIKDNYTQIPEVMEVLNRAKSERDLNDVIDRHYTDIVNGFRSYYL